MKGQVLVLLILLCVIPALAAKVPQAGASTITVPDDYLTIQEAINSAGEGDTIFVRNGTYHENVELNKTLSLVGESSASTIIDANGSGTIIHVTGDNSNVKGFKLQNCGPEAMDAGVTLYCDNSHILENNITGNRRGVWARGGSWNISIIRNEISNNSEGIFVHAESTKIINNTIVDNYDLANGFGITISATSDNVICNNTITGNLYGIYVHKNPLYPNLARHKIESNYIADNGWEGIFLYSSHGNNLTANVVRNNGYGINIHSRSDSTTIVDNTVTENNIYGIRLHISDGNTISNNLISASQTGLLLIDSINTSISGNNIIDNEDGFTIQGLGTNNQLYHNNFVNNLNQAHLTGSPNCTWDNGCEGNFWSDYNGTDLDGNGIGDTPYQIDPDEADPYPLMNPYWHPADINKDLKINIYDAVLVGASYYATPSDPHWNCHCDIVESFGIIDIFDVVLMADSYGEEYHGP